MRMFDKQPVKLGLYKGVAGMGRWIVNVAGISQARTYYGLSPQVLWLALAGSPCWARGQRFCISINVSVDELPNHALILRVMF